MVKIFMRSRTWSDLRRLSELIRDYGIFNITYYTNSVASLEGECNSGKVPVIVSLVKASKIKCYINLNGDLLNEVVGLLDEDIQPSSYISIINVENNDMEHRQFELTIQKVEDITLMDVEGFDKNMALLSSESSDLSFMSRQLKECIVRFPSRRFSGTFRLNYNFEI